MEKQKSSEDIILDHWVSGTSVDSIVEELRKNGYNANKGRYRSAAPFCYADIWNIIARARKRGDVRAIFRAQKNRPTGPI